MAIPPDKRRLVVATTPNSLFSAILCLQHVRATNSPVPVLAVSSDYAGRDNVADFERTMRALIGLYSWHGVIWFTGMRGMLSYHFVDTMFPPALQRRRMNLNDRAIAVGIVRAAENLYRLAGEASTIEEVWLEGPEFPASRLIWNLLPRSRKILYPHSPDFQTAWDLKLRQSYAQKYYRGKAWSPLKYRLSEMIYAEPVSQYRLKWDDICTLNESPEMGAPITDCSAQLEEDSLRRLAERLPEERCRALKKLAATTDRDSTALLMLGNLGDRYLDEEAATYAELLTVARERKPIKKVLVKAHPRHPVKDRDFMIERLQQQFPDLLFEKLDSIDGLPIELVLPLIPCCLCIAGWTTAVTAVHKIKKIPIFVGVSRLKELVYATPNRKEMFEEFLNYLPKYAEVI
jgi:hypothetical protein